MPASAWLRPLMIAAVIAFITGGLGLLLDQPRLAPIGLFIGELLTILAAIAWNTPKLPLFGETRSIGPSAEESTNVVAATPLAHDGSDTEADTAATAQDDAV